jgi:hypothetical protein
VKIIKNILLVLGLLAIIAVGVMAFFNWQDIRNLYFVGTANQSSTRLENPNTEILITLGAGMLAGVILGMGIAFPRRRKPSQKDLDEMVQKGIKAHDEAQTARTIASATGSAGWNTEAAEQPQEQR